jgi:hypothetical protein
MDQPAFNKHNDILFASFLRGNVIRSNVLLFTIAIVRIQMDKFKQCVRMLDVWHFEKLNTILFRRYMFAIYLP